MKRLGFKNGEHSPIIGWAADGFPIYALHGYSDPMEASSAIEEMKTGYALKKGERLGGRNAPDGNYDGAFAEDYEDVGGDGTLDECNGRFCVTPEFPGGTYAYFMTRDWPVIPRAFRGMPEQLNLSWWRRTGCAGSERWSSSGRSSSSPIGRVNRVR